MGGSRGAGGGAGVQRKQQLFPKGSLVEIGSDEEGFKGAWYVATILDTPSSSYRSSSPSSKKKNDLFFVEYQSLLDDDGSTPLREHVKPDFVRPLPPPPSSESDLVPSFELYDVVDASYRDGWWTGVITLVLNNSRFIVTFQNPPDEIEFGVSELRVHREWVDGKWVLPEKQRTTGLKFSAGKRVEVSFDKEDYRDFWFPATVLEDLGNDSFVVEYWSLGNGSEAELQKATVDLLHIRPSPPDLKGRNFVLLEKVDAFYNSGWKSGVITKELADRRYIVYFKHTNKDMELNQSDLRPHMEWIDGKWIAASQDVLIPSDYEEHVGNACIGLNNTQMAVQLASSGVTKDKSEEKTPSINSRENQTEQSTPCDGSPSSRGMASLRKKTKQKNPDIEVSHSRPSKKLKEGNAPETPSLTPYQLNTMLVQATCEENLPSFSSPSTGGAGTNCSKQSMDGDQLFTKPRSRSRGKKILMQQDKPQKVVELDHCASGAVKEKGRPQKLQVKSPQPSTGGKKGKAGVDTAKEFDVKECITKEVDIPVIIGLPCNGMRSPQSENHHQFASEECLKSITDQKEQLNDPAREQIEEINQLKSGEDIPKKKRGRPPKLPRESPNASLTDKKQNGDVVAADEMIVKDCITEEVELPTITEAESKKLPNSPTRRQNISSSMMKTPPVKKDKMPNEKVMQASSELLEKPSSKRGRRRNTIVNIESLIQDSQEASRVKSNEGIQTDSRMKEVGMANDQVPSNVSDDQPLSTWLGGMHFPTIVDGSRVSPSRTAQQCTVTSERKMEIAVRAATVDGNGNILSVPNQNLPFVKTFPLWETIESMDVFQSMPQNPHFRPLESCKESAREGLAIGCMVTFSSVVKKTTELQFDGPRSSIEDCLETLLDLEGHGFDVKMLRDRLTGLLLIKDKQEFLQDQSKELESRIMAHSHEKSKIDEEIDEINKQIKELKEKRALAMSTMKIKDSEIVSLQSTMNDINEGIETIRLDFEELAADYW
ncbi:unnamed protein product [Camellia sinensis]